MDIEECTLPTAARPLRVAEFDELFTTSLRGLDRPTPGLLRLDLEPSPDVAERAANLVMRETECCSFFTFSLIATGGRLQLAIAVPDAQVSVLDALQSRASG